MRDQFVRGISPDLRDGGSRDQTYQLTSCSNS